MSSAPATPIEFSERLLQLSEGLPPRLRQCGEHIAANLDSIAVSTVAGIAQRADVPPSAVMRFAQAMGFTGYSDMQRMFRAAYTTPPPDYESRLKALKLAGTDSPAALLAEFIESGRRSLGNLAATIDPRALDAAVQKLSNARVVHLIGLRRSFPVAAYLAYTFEKMGIAAVLHDGIGKLNPTALIQPEDAVLAITFRPYSDETIQLSQIARDKGADLIAITDAGLGPMRRLGAITLEVSESSFGAFRPLAATMTLAIALSVALGAALGGSGETE